MRKQYHHGDLKNALIRAGAELLASEGMTGLSLRKAAQRAGVSHSAPYAHFADKQELVAAISTEGLQRVRERIELAVRRHPRDPQAQLVEAAWAVVQFGLAHPDQYRVTFSNAIEREEDFPAYVATAHGGFEALVELVKAAQAAGVIDPGPPDIAALGLWSLVHGLIALLIGRQVPRRLRETEVRELLLQVLGTRLRIPTTAGEGARPSRRGAAKRPARPAARRPTR